MGQSAIRKNKAFFPEEIGDSAELLFLDVDSDVTKETVDVEFTGTFLSKKARETGDGKQVTEVEDEELSKQVSFPRIDRSYPKLLPVMTPSRLAEEAEPEDTGTEFLFTRLKSIQLRSEKEKKSINVNTEFLSPSFDLQDQEEDLEKDETEDERRLSLETAVVENPRSGIHSFLPFNRSSVSNVGEEERIDIDPAQRNKNRVKKNNSQEEELGRLTPAPQDRKSDEKEIITELQEEIEWLETNIYETIVDHTYTNYHPNKENTVKEDLPEGHDLGSTKDELTAFEESSSLSELVEKANKHVRIEERGETATIAGKEYGVMLGTGDDGRIKGPFDFALDEEDSFSPKEESELEVTSILQMESFSGPVLFEEVFVGYGNVGEEKIKGKEKDIWSEALKYAEQKLEGEREVEKYVIDGISNLRQALHDPDLEIGRKYVKSRLEHLPVDITPEQNFEEEWREFSDWKKILLEANGIEPDLGEELPTEVNAQLGQEEYNQVMGEAVRSAKRNGAEKVAMPCNCNGASYAANAMQDSAYETPDMLVMIDAPNLTYIDDLPEEIIENPFENDVLIVNTDIKDRYKPNYDEEGNPLSLSVEIPEVNHFLDGNRKDTEAYQKGFSRDGSYIREIIEIFERYKSAQKRKEGVAWLSDNYGLELNELAPSYSEDEFAGILDEPRPGEVPPTDYLTSGVQAVA